MTLFLIQEPLSDREIEVLQLLSKGLPYKQIGKQLFISHETVKKHLKNIYQKLHVQNKIEANNSNDNGCGFPCMKYYFYFRVVQ